MLYMKTRVTFRVDPELAEQLRELPNQTYFVESALREALRQKCPFCAGTGRVPSATLRVSNFRRAALPRLERDTALQLKGLVGVARRVGASAVVLEPATSGAFGFAVTRGQEVLLRGTLSGAETRLRAN
jgi:hypothetical protein